jgi:hypothetical protein
MSVGVEEGAEVAATEGAAVGSEEGTAVGVTEGNTDDGAGVPEGRGPAGITLWFEVKPGLVGETEEQPTKQQTAKPIKPDLLCIFTLSTPSANPSLVGLSTKLRTLISIPLLVLLV